jgi:diguanylate cyclase (GGDEF)-like protein/PAS domain S-box-containing protein
MRADDCPAVETSEFLLAALDQANDAVVIVDGDHRVRHFNAAAGRVWGFPRTEVLGRDADLLGLHDHQLQQIAADQADDGRIKRKRDSEITIHHRDGQPVQVALSVSRVAIDGHVSTMVFVRDLTVEILRRDRMALLNLVADRTNRAVVVTDRNLGIVYSNAAFAGLFGHTPEDAMGQQVNQLLAGQHTDTAALARLQRRVAAGHDGEEEILTYDRNNEEIWVSIAAKAFRDEHGRIKYLFALLTDISETKQLRSLQQLIMGTLADEVPITEIFDRLCRRVEIIAPDIVSSVLHVDADGVIHPLGGPSLPAEYSRALDGVVIGPDIGSCGSAAFFGKAVLADDIDTDPRWQPFKAMPLAAGLKGCWSTPIKAKDGRVIGTFAFYFRESRAPSRWHQRIVDACVHLGALAIERKEARAQIARLAYHDMLTGLPNRAQLRHLIEQAIDGCHDGQNVALLFLDIDHFKDVNDTLGHSAGDELLVELTRRLRARTQSGDILGRLGGDEFVIVLPNGGPARASLLASEITEALASPLRLGDREVPISASMGISIYPDNATDIDMLMQQADAAMYKAKQAGRATHRFFSVDMNRLDEQRLSHIAALRNAIANDVLKLHYQPQTRTIDGSLYGAEALARWHDPDLGDVPPLKFIRLAEECGLIEQIGLWSIREACRQLAAWRRAGLDVPCVSVNLSPINFQNRRLASVVAETLTANDLPPDALMLEITESVLMNERSVAIETMNAIRKLGVGLSLDDFGTGYSSLSRLAHLPIRELKIDRAFMRDIESEASALAVATAVVRVGQSLKMTVVAEGVETEGQRDVLKALGCDVVQGYLFAPALAPEAFERWLLNHSVAQASTMLHRLSQSLSQPPEAAIGSSQRTVSQAMAAKK